MASESLANRLERSAKASGPIVAERLFESKEGGKTVRVRINKPQRDPKTRNHWCSFKVSGLGTVRSFKVWGVDSLQALQLAIRAAGELLRDEGSGLTWCGDSDLGFPKVYPSFLSPKAQSKIERKIEREIAKEQRPSRKR